MIKQVPLTNDLPNRRAKALAILPCALLLMLTACSSTPIAPTQKIQAAELAITKAEQTRVADYASPELNQAREKLTASRTAVHDEKMVLAAQLADESRTSAELATAKAEVIKAKTVNDEMQKSIDTLKQEMRRNSGNVQ